MKWSFNHKSRKAFLAAAICLALSQSVFAMPTGGKIVQGDITGITDGKIASGGTINVNGSGLIDWNAFNIANGESLTYAFSNPGTLINHVTGEEMSRILGTLSSTGNGNLWLINPNGILIGPNAHIDTSSLVLSTLNASDDKLKGFLNGNNLILTGTDASKGIEIQGGATINVENALNMFGGHIQIADNVTVSSAKADSVTMSIAAANQATFEAGSSTDGATDISTSSGNTLALGKATFDIKNPFSDVYFVGHDVSVDGTKINLTSETDKNSTSLDIIAANHLGYQKIENDDENGVLDIDGSNTLSVNGADLTANYMGLVGGKTSIDSSNLTLSKTTNEVKEGTVMPYMRVAALNGKGIIFDDVNGDVQNAENTDASRLSIKVSTLTSNENIALWGGSVELANTNLKTAAETDAKANNIDIEAFKSLGDNTMTTDSSNTVKVTGGSMESGGDILVQGSNVAFDGIKNVKAEDGIFLLAGNQFKSEGDDTALTDNTAANAVSVKDTTMNTTHAMALIGGKIDVTNANLTAGDLEVTAGQSYASDGNTITGTDATNVSISGSTIKAAQDATFFGSNVNLVKTNLTVGTSGDKMYPANGVVRIAAGKDIKLAGTDEKGYVISEVNGTGDASLDGTTMTALGNVDVYGKTVAVKDSNLSTNNADGAELSLNALQHYQRKDGSDDTWVATKDNTLSVTNSKLQNNDFVELAGGNVTLDKSEIKAGDASIAARSGYESVATDKNNDTTVIRHTAADGMNVVIKDSTVTSDSGLDITGHDVTIDGKSNMSAKDFLAVGTGTDITIDFEKNTVTANGKAVKVSPDAQFQSNNKVIKPGTEIIENTKPDKPIVTPDLKPAVDIEKNIEQGKQDMTKALADNPDQTVAAAKQQSEKLSNSDMTAEEKAAQFKGYADAIQETQATAEEKQDLIKETVKSFEPTQQAGLEAQNKQDEAAQNQNAKAVIPDVAVKTDSPAAHEHVAAEVTVDGQAVHE
ncbi:filamentous hemagglutinin N-terminal domain-containing protein [uncultured Mitsuokella sp.]|uniref:filamentous hemagglutinin N-terminal domain-containing protein n=1 Tax=uncultured Mitsuokella sp. TaxID=453120 RepID=UPI002619D6EE|nr:filamentous hemagglutinin N-terminal domain-containing protein [uncultured Mitsuokella sp.]